MPRRRSPTVLGLLAALTAVLSVVSGVSAGEPFDGDRPSLTVIGAHRTDVQGLLPGASVPTQTLLVTASGCLALSVDARFDGSEALAQALRIEVTEARSGRLVLTGSLADPATAGDPFVLCAGTTELHVDAELDLAAGNEVQGQSLRVEWVVQGVEVASRP